MPSHEEAVAEETVGPTSLHSVAPTIVTLVVVAPAAVDDAADTAVAADSVVEDHLDAPGGHLMAAELVDRTGSAFLPSRFSPDYALTRQRTPLRHQGESLPVPQRYCQLQWKSHLIDVQAVGPVSSTPNGKMKEGLGFVGADGEMYYQETATENLLGHFRTTSWHPRVGLQAKEGTVPAASLGTAYFPRAATANHSEQETVSILSEDCDRKLRTEECRVGKIPPPLTLPPWPPPSWLLQVLTNLYQSFSCLWWHQWYAALEGAKQMIH